MQQTGSCGCGGGVGKVAAASHGSSCVVVPGGGHHEDAVRVGQCWSAVVQPIAAPVGVVWSVVRCFDRPQA
jgi:abscisic acid receptor (PYR/PYL family)